MVKLRQPLHRVTDHRIPLNSPRRTFRGCENYPPCQLQFLLDHSLSGCQALCPQLCHLSTVQDTHDMIEWPPATHTHSFRRLGRSFAEFHHSPVVLPWFYSDLSRGRSFFQRGSILELSRPISRLIGSQCYSSTWFVSTMVFLGAYRRTVTPSLSTPSGRNYSAL